MMRNSFLIFLVMCLSACSPKQCVHVHVKDGETLEYCGSEVVCTKQKTSHGELRDCVLDLSKIEPE